MDNKRMKLKSPLFFIARNRISVRNVGGNGLWKSAKEGSAKLGALFASAASRGMEEGVLTGPEIDDFKESLALARSRAATSSRGGRRGPDARARDNLRDERMMETNTDAAVDVVSSVLLVDKTRLDAKGKPKSKGFGFVEFTHHAHALAVSTLTNGRSLSFCLSFCCRFVVSFASLSHPLPPLPPCYLGLR